MRILYLAAGVDDFYCGANARDASLIRGLRQLGHDVEAISLYAPFRVDDGEVESEVFRCLRHNPLQRIFPRLAVLPRTVGDFFRDPRPIRGAASFALGSHTDRIGPLAVAALSGRDKRQRKELSRISDYLAGRPNPDAAVISGSLLSGLVEPLKRNFGCPIVCMDQGGDGFVEAMAEPYRSDVRKLIRNNARSFSLVVATSLRSAMRAVEFLAVSAARVRIVSPGIDNSLFANPGPRKSDPFTIGYLSTINKTKGLSTLVDAMEIMKGDSSAPLPHLWIAGRVGDSRYWQRAQRRMKALDLMDRVRVFGEVGLEEKREFFRGLSVFAMPSREPEARATVVLEAMSAGVPAVGPALGIIPELFQRSQGGLLVSADAPAWMFAQVFTLLANMPNTADSLGQAAAAGIERHFTMRRSAGALAECLEELRRRP